MKNLKFCTPNLNLSVLLSKLSLRVNAVLQVDFLGESTTGNLRFVHRVTTEGLINVLGMQQLDDIENTPYKDLKRSQQVHVRQNTVL